jgi:ribosomal protein S18 acetylase RimI-like enzyme
MTIKRGYLVRPARPQDAGAVARVHVETWRVAYRGELPDDVLDNLSVERRTRLWYERLSEPAERSLTLVAEAQRVIVGFASTGDSRDDDADELVGELHALYLDSSYWGRGLGRALQEQAVEQLARDGFTAATLWVLRSNARARAFYERVGWAADGADRTVQLGSVPLHEVRYTRSLEVPRLVP